MRRAVVPLTVVLANDADMREVLAAGRASETPSEPVWLKARADTPGLWELADGHHRVADLLRRGAGEVDAELDPVPDDEPLEGPFFDFAAALHSRRYAVAIQPGCRTADLGDLPAAAANPLAAEPQLDISEYEGRVGDPTHITRSERGLMPTEAIAHLHGVKGELPGEHRNRQGPEWAAFKRHIAANGVEHPVFITVDHGQEPKISEGNHRRDAAVELGLPNVPVEVRYFGHSERQGTVMDRMRRTAGPRAKRPDIAATARTQRRATIDFPQHVSGQPPPMPKAASPGRRQAQTTRTSRRRPSQ